MSVALQCLAVTEEATLDAFASESGDSDEATAETSTGGSDSEDGTGDAVEVVAVTSSWSDDDGLCPSCGERAGRLWREGSERVCTACKSWTRTGEGACDQ